MTADRWRAGLNADTDHPALVASLHACCAASAWIDAILAGRPYSTDDALYAASDAAMTALDDDGLVQALAAHPRIGERPAGAGTEATWSSQEQAGMADADHDVRTRISEANQRYEERFGQVYLVCAAGLGPSELLAICLERLGNDPLTERAVVRTELAKIARLRLTRLLHPGTAQ